MLEKNEYGSDDLVDGSWLSFIFANCPSLNWLVLDTPGFISLGSEKSDLQYLKMGSLWQRFKEDIYPETNKDIYKQLSERLPCLKYLHVYDAHGRSCDWKYEEIEMLFSALDTFTWSRRCKTAKVNEDWKAYFMIKTENAVSFYFADVGRITAVSGATYSDARNADEQCVYFQCKSVKRLCVKVRDYCDSCYFLSFSIDIA